jgi:hypothetical protein
VYEFGVWYVKFIVKLPDELVNDMIVAPTVLEVEILNAVSESTENM